MGVKVDFDYQAWITLFPEFANVSEPQADALFVQAQLFCVNDGSGPVCDPLVQTNLLYLMMAHLAALFQLANGQPVNELVGRITNATQGSVTLAVNPDIGVEDGPSQWLAQTKYGYAYWYATAPYRMFRYFPGPRRYFGPIYGGRPF